MKSDGQKERRWAGKENKERGKKMRGDGQKIKERREKEKINGGEKGKRK